MSPSMLVPSCTNRTVDPTVFFPDNPEQLAAARAVCAGCPLVGRCLADALAIGTSDGVWGGVLLERGAVAHDKRKRGRPPKVLTAPVGAAA